MIHDRNPTTSFSTLVTLRHAYKHTYARAHTHTHTQHVPLFCLPLSVLWPQILAVLGSMLGVVSRRMVELGAVQGLLLALLNTSFFESQHEACRALAMLTSRHPFVRRALSTGALDTGVGRGNGEGVASCLSVESDVVGNMVWSQPWGSNRTTRTHALGHLAEKCFSSTAACSPANRLALGKFAGEIEADPRSAAARVTAEELSAAERLAEAMTLVEV